MAHSLVFVSPDSKGKGINQFSFDEGLQFVANDFVEQLGGSPLLA